MAEKEASSTKRRSAARKVSVKKATPASRAEVVERLVEQVTLEEIRVVACTSNLYINGEQLEPVLDRLEMEESAELGWSGEEGFLAFVFFEVKLSEASFKQSQAEEEEIEPTPEPSEPDDLKDPFVIRVFLELDYSYPEGFSPPKEDDLRSFVQRVSLFNAWPYWRELVQSLTLRMGGPTITVPLRAPKPNLGK